MNLFFLHPANNNLKEQSDEHKLVHNESPTYADEGGEYLDDALRMEDLPLSYTEESAAAESPEQ